MKYAKQVSLFFRTLHQEAALDSLTHVLAIIGFGTVIGDFMTMRYWMFGPALALFFIVWRIDYWRHFRGESADESLVRELKEVL